MGLKIVAFVWGLAEATLFFIVPDVLLTFVAARSGRRAAQCCVWVLFGALLGGALMYGWGASDEAGALETLEKIPAISKPMLAKVDEDLAAQGVMALFWGPVRGVPYKIYAVQSASNDIPLRVFFLVSIPARLIRFALLSLLSWAFFRFVAPRWPMRARDALIATLWIAFYIFYFAIQDT